MSKTTTIALALAASLFGANAMAQDSGFASMVLDYGYAPGLSAKAEPAVVVAAKPVAEKAVVAKARFAGESNNSQAAALARADAELGIIPAARKAAPAATMLAGK